MIATMQQEETIISAQQKWSESDKFARERMLQSIGWPSCFARESWSRLKHVIQENLNRKTWTK
jgi:hypothetical protein